MIRMGQFRSRWNQEFCRIFFSWWFFGICSEKESRCMKVFDLNKNSPKTKGNSNCPYFQKRQNWPKSEKSFRSYIIDFIKSAFRTFPAPISFPTDIHIKVQREIVLLSIKPVIFARLVIQKCYEQLHCIRTLPRTFTDNSSFIFWNTPGT